MCTFNGNFEKVLFKNNYSLGLKLWSINIDYYYEEAKKLYSKGVFDYIELYVVPKSLNTLEKWKNFVSPLSLGERVRERADKRHRVLSTGQAQEKAKNFRKNQTESEQILWKILRNRQLNNLKFRRQEPIGNYIADFICYEKNLIIELDGGQHLDNEHLKYDKNRDEFLKLQGFNVIKIYNTDIYKNPEEVIKHILDFCRTSNEKLSPHPNPLPKGEGKIPFIIHCPHFAHGFNLAKKEKKNTNQEIYKEVKQFADTLNARYIIFHGGIDGNIEETANQLADFNEPRALIENKPFIALPNRMGGEFCRGYNFDEIKLVKDTARCGFCLDFGHAICAANSMFSMSEAEKVQRIDYIYDYIEQLIKLNPNMYHLTDNTDIESPYDSHPHLGTGQIDLARIKSFLPKDAIITLETNKNSKENLDDFIEDTKYMRK